MPKSRGVAVSPMRGKKANRASTARTRTANATRSPINAIAVEATREHGIIMAVGSPRSSSCVPRAFFVLFVVAFVLPRCQPRCYGPYARSAPPFLTRSSRGLDRAHAADDEHVRAGSSGLGAGHTRAHRGEARTPGAGITRPPANARPNT